jgi:hypothetical protein
MNYRASQVTRVDLSTDRQIVTGGTVTIFGIIVANSSLVDAEVDFSDVAGDKQITVVVPSHDTKILEFEFVADGGFVVDGIGSAEVVATVFHSSTGS